MPVYNRFKCVLAGEGATGKTTLLNRIKHGYFSQTHKLTIGGDVVILDMDVNQRQVKLFCWDSGGQARFSCIRQAFYRGAHGFIIVFDVTRYYSFDAVKSWYYELQKNISNIPWVLVGNKIDMIMERQVSEAEGIELASKLGAISYIDCSVKTGINVRKPLEQLIEQMIIQHEPDYSVEHAEITV